MLSTTTYCVKRLLGNGIEAWRHDGLRPSDPPVRVKHIVYHSPDGFECGYGGSGPADLALSILADFTGETERNPRRDPPGIAIRNHQEFKWRFIAGLSLRPGEEKYIAGNDIAAMLDQIEPEWRCAPAVNIEEAKLEAEIPEESEEGKSPYFRPESTEE